MNNQSDIDLIRKVKAGDILAYEVLVRRYETKLFWFLRRWTDEEGLIEEVIQDSLFKLYKNIGKVDEDKKLASYLFTIAKNELTDRFRVQKKTLPLLEEVAGTDGEYLYEKIEKQEVQNKVQQALGKLKLSQRKVLEMYFFDQLSYKRIGTMMGMPLNTIKTNIRRAKKSLLKMWKHE